MKDEIRFAGSNIVIRTIMMFIIPLFVFITILCINLQNGTLLNISYEKLILLLLEKLHINYFVQVFIFIIISVYGFESINSFGLQLQIKYSTLSKWLINKYVCSLLLITMAYILFHTILFIAAFCMGSNMALLGSQGIINLYLYPLLISVAYGELYMTSIFICYRLIRR